jgi:GR25 family glycosyltransferase involved in LPS biosynthesis
MELVFRNGTSASIFEYLALTFHFTAAIYRDRNMPHMDDRITDTSKVELASYNRLTTSSSILSVNVSATNATQQLNQVSETNGVLPPCRLLGLLVRLDACNLDELTTLSLCKLQEEQEISISYEEFLACVSAKRELEIRQVDNYLRLVNTPMVFTPSHTGKTPIQHYSDQLVNSILTKDLDSVPVSTLNVAFRSCHITGDGRSLFRLSSWLMTALSDKKDENVSFQHLLGILESSCHALTVRVINLRRRPDRLALFMSQAMLHRLIVVKGVTDVLHRTRPEGESHFALEGLIGGFAIDGQGKAAEVEKTLINLVGGNPEDLNRLVETHWFPNELKPFDRAAPSADRRVLISPSEKACALSHIACWKGVERSLAEVNSNPLDGQVFHSLSRFRQRFLVSGYARGPSLSGESKGPTPVCVILEDDAILVDRFSDRLACVLDELPRDFHFCSLGYSRPKTAPLVPFSDHVSVPTSIWYLTGYILSLEGARFLLDRLPVRGPVDSWVGIAMFSNNWDNVFGHSLGVGVSSKMHQDTAVSRANLRKILRFRAFAAAIPLCSQKVGNSSKSAFPTGHKSWRQRDTDIVYSGNA